MVAASEPPTASKGMHGYPVEEDPEMYGVMFLARYPQDFGGKDLGEVNWDQYHPTVAKLLGIKPCRWRKGQAAHVAGRMSHDRPRERRRVPDPAHAADRRGVPSQQKKAHLGGPVGPCAPDHQRIQQKPARAQREKTRDQRVPESGEHQQRLPPRATPR